MTYKQIYMTKQAARRPLKQSQEVYKNTGNQASQILGPFTSGILPVAASAALGGALAGTKGAKAGFYTGAGLVGATQVIAQLVASLRGGRTSRQQLEHDSSRGSALINYLVPGAALYNKTMRQKTDKRDMAKLRQLSAQR